MRRVKWLAILGLLLTFSGIPQYAHLFHAHPDHADETCGICQTLAVLKAFVLVIPVSLVVALCPILVFHLPRFFSLLRRPLDISLARAPPSCN